MNSKKTFLALAAVTTLLVVAGCQTAEQVPAGTEQTPKENTTSQNVGLTVTEPVPGMTQAQTGETVQVDQTAKPLPETVQFPNMGTQEGLKAPELKLPPKPADTQE